MEEVTNDKDIYSLITRLEIFLQFFFSLIFFTFSYLLKYVVLLIGGHEGDFWKPEK